MQLTTWRTFRIFLFFFGSGRGGGVSEAAGRGGVGRFFIECPTRGGGGEGPGGCLRRIGDFFGGGAKYFFSGPKCPPRLSVTQLLRVLSSEPKLCHK